MNYEQESTSTFTGYGYGAPRQNMGPGQPQQPGPASRQQAAGQASNPGCMGFILALLSFGILGAWDYKIERERTATERYKADRNLDAVIAQVTARLEDTTRHLQAGIAPGVTIHDMDRTGWGVSQPTPQPMDGSAGITVQTQAGPVTRAQASPFEITLTPGDYTYRPDADM